MTHICSVCQQPHKSDTVWIHNLTPGLVASLIKAVEAVHAKNKNSFHLQRDLSLTKSEYNNFQKLRFFALVAKTEEKGCWLITARGGQFLRGEIAVPSQVKSFQNEVQHDPDFHPRLVHINDFRRKLVEFQGFYEAEWRKPRVNMQGILSCANQI